MPDDDEILTAMSLVDEDGNPIGFDTLGDAAAALAEYMADGGKIEIHGEGCDGEPECGCGFETNTMAELMP